MIPRARHTDIAAPAKNDVMALSIMTGEATHRTRPANDVKAEDRQNLLVRRRRRFARLPAPRQSVPLPIVAPASPRPHTHKPRRIISP